MDTRGVLRPVGPLPPRVYWLRRLLPLALLLVLIIVIAVSCSGGSSGKSGTATLQTSPSPTPSSSISTSTRPSPTPTPTASKSTTANAGSCHAKDLAVTASTDASTYPAGKMPLLKVTVRNAGAGSCVLFQSPSRRNWTVKSGNDVVWSTVGCPKSTAAIETTLAPNQSVVHTLAWNRHRTGAHCTASSATAAAGTYQLLVVFDGVRSSVAVFQLAK